MADDLSNRGIADRIRVNFRERHERRYWTQRFGCTVLELEEAVHAVGVMSKDVKAFLENKKDRPLIG